MAPTRQRVIMTRLANRVGRRGLALLFLSILDAGVSYGLFTVNTYDAYTRTALLYAYAGQTAMLPLTAWAWVWAIVGCVCAVQAFAKHDRLAFLLAAALKVGWAAGFMIGCIYYGIPRAWLPFIIFMAFSAFVLMISGWRENHSSTIIVVPDPPEDTQ